MTKKYACFGLKEGSQLFTSFRYPAGEMQLRLTDAGLAMAKDADEIDVIARIKTDEDIVSLAHLKSALDGANPVGAKNLRLAYLPYARADRRFLDGDCWGLGVFATLLNAMNFSTVFTLDTHSAVSSKLVNNLVNVLPVQYIRRAITRFSLLHGAKHLTILYPDEGARHRYGLPLQIGNNVGVVHLHEKYCTKKRDPVTGKLSGFEVPDLDSKYAMIVDDLCDGGGTFLGIADALDSSTKDYLGLYVTHGIFSQGVDRLLEKFSNIYTTNSFREDLGPKVVVFDSYDFV